MSKAVSRRGFFTAFSRSLTGKSAADKAGATPAAPVEMPPAAAVARTAIVQGRLCIALTSFCSVCVERCPVPGAIRTERGLPMVVSDVCTGCGICHDVCPAPRKAILLLPRRTATPSSSPTA